MYGSTSYDLTPTHNRADVLGYAIQSVPPWASADDLNHNGFAVVCAHAEPWCLSAMEEQQRKHSSALSLALDVTRRFLGHVGQPQRVLLLFVPPQQKAPPARSDSSSAAISRSIASSPDYNCAENGKRVMLESV